jgi:hypothetical protein
MIFQHNFSSFRLSVFVAITLQNKKGKLQTSPFESNDVLSAYYFIAQIKN